jgi:hypothetical protein
MASTTHPDISTPELVIPEQLVPDQPETVSEPDFMITSEASNVEDEQLYSSSNVIVKSISDQPSTNNQTPTSTNSQPSSSTWLFKLLLLPNHKYPHHQPYF